MLIATRYKTVSKSFANQKSNKTHWTESCVEIVSNEIYDLNIENKVNSALTIAHASSNVDTLK
jgi:hypothetical protein